MPSSSSPNPRRHLLFTLLMVASAGMFWSALRELWELSLSADAYSYILAIPVVSAFFLYSERRAIFATASVYPSLPAVIWPGLALAAYSLIAVGAIRPPAEYLLSIKVVLILLVWTTLFALCYGSQILQAARFPLLLLLLAVPIPSHLMDRIVTSLQWGAAEATYQLFQLAGVPVFRNGVRFELPQVGIEIAKECSSIHSACALFITGILVGHLFLKSLWAKVCLTLLTLPVAMLTNAVRIATIWFLGTRVNVGFFYGSLHHDGGIVFALVSLSILLGCLYLLRTLESRGPVVAAMPRTAGLA
jgi:exosortase